MNREMIDLYSDYLITNFGQATATGLSNILDGEISHDIITRCLAERELTSKDYWQIAKTKIRAIFGMFIRVWLLSLPKSELEILIESNGGK